MYTECFIKSFLLIAVIFLIIKCWSNNESFASIDFTSAKLAEKIKNFLPVKLDLYDAELNKYVFATFNQLNEDNQKIIIDKLKDNSEFMVKETIQDVEKGIFYKNPIFIVADPNNKLNNSEKIDFILIPESGSFALSPVIPNKNLGDHYLYFDKKIGLIYYSKNGPNNDLILVNSNGFQELFGLEKNWSNTDLKTIKKVDNKKLIFKISIE